MKEVFKSNLFFMGLLASSLFFINCQDGIDGVNGENGIDGTNGVDGLTVLSKMSSESAGSNCVLGGVKIELGLDANSNNVLENSEVTNTDYLCNGTNGTDGSDGTNGLNVLISTEEESEGNNCSSGGIKVNIGLDLNSNAILEASEITVVDYICNGQDYAEPTLLPLTESVVPNSVFKLVDPAVKVDMIMTSQDILPSDPSFVYGSFTDGCALFDNGDETYSFIVNLERDFSIARIKMNKKLQPLKGDYIVNSNATAFTAMCSGSGISKEEHGFGPMYLSGGEWVGQGAGAQGVYVVDPYKDPGLASFATRSAAMGEWATENAVVVGKNAYPNKTVAIIGDDDSSNSYPEGHLGMYVGARGDLFGGDLFVLKGKNPVETEPNQGGQLFEMGMKEGVTYDAEWVAMTERTKNELNQEAIDSLVIGFQRIEDIDWRKGSADNERALFFCVTGRYRSDNPDLAKRGTTFGRIYMVELNDDDPTGDCKITCILDGDKVGGKADGFHSPDNIVVTENYVYIQEDPNGYFDQNSAIKGWAKLYKYEIATGNLSTVLECDEDNNPQYGGGGKWEITGMIDVTDIIDASEPTFMCGVQVHGWEVDKIDTAVRADGHAFFDPKAIAEGLSDLEGSFLFKITGLPR